MKQEERPPNPTTYTAMKEKTYKPDGATIGTAIDHLNKTHEAIKPKLADMRAERDKNKNEEITIPSTSISPNVSKTIKYGTLYQKAVLYLHNIDSTRTFKAATLTEEEAQQIREELYSSENWVEGAMYTKTYNAFIQYGKLLEIMRLSYQNEAKELTRLIDLWETYQERAISEERLVKNGILTLDTPLHLSTKSKNVTITIYPNGNVTLDDEKIRAEIKEQADRTSRALSKVKAFIEPLSDYIYEEGDPPLWPLLPYQMEMWMDYPDAIKEQADPDKAKYFRFILRKRKEDGEEVTPEEEELALYPDYNEVEIDQPTLKFAQQQLSDIFYLWEVQKREKPQAKKRGRPRKIK